MRTGPLIRYWESLIGVLFLTVGPIALSWNSDTYMTMSVFSYYVWWSIVFGVMMHQLHFISFLQAYRIYMVRKNKANVLLRCMLQPELRNRDNFTLAIPAINIMDPETLAIFLDMNDMVREFQYITSYRVVIYIAIEFASFGFFTLLMYLELF
jgi:hypothetical protein